MPVPAHMMLNKHLEPLIPRPPKTTAVRIQNPEALDEMAMWALSTPGVEFKQRGYGMSRQQPYGVGDILLVPNESFEDYYRLARSNSTGMPGSSVISPNSSRSVDRAIDNLLNDIFNPF